MNKMFLILLTVILLCIADKTHPAGEKLFIDRHMKNVTQLTFEGDNGEAYFSWDDTKLIFQSNRGNEPCDKIWIMNVDGSGKRMVSPDHGAHTCLVLFCQAIIFLIIFPESVSNRKCPDFSIQSNYHCLFPNDTFLQ